jgi:hypothetical protein
LGDYWQHDALLQLLLHAVRVLLLHGPAAHVQQQQQEGRSAADAAADEAQSVSVEEQQQQQQQQQAQRAVGLPELLEAVQQLSKVRHLGVVYICTCDGNGLHRCLFLQNCTPLRVTLPKTLCAKYFLQGASPHFLWELEQFLMEHFCSAVTGRAATAAGPPLTASTA